MPAKMVDQISEGTFDTGFCIGSKDWNWIWKINVYLENLTGFTFVMIDLIIFIVYSLLSLLYLQCE